MARPGQALELDCEEAFSRAAARAVEARAADLFAHVDGVLDLDDVEPLHDMRVASRRLRAALEMFRPCFPSKRYKRALKRVKELADALGERRDRDVAIAFLADFAEGAPAADRGRLEILLARLRDEQRQANERLAPVLAEERLEELREAIDRAGQGGTAMKARKVKGLKPGKPLRPNAARIVATRLDELRGLANEALVPGAEGAQHDMRIAAKRLRYVLEIVETCFGPDGERARRVARELQKVLGEIHDCDVMLPQVAGIGSLETLLRTRRELLHGRFRELWGDPRTEEALSRLSRAL